MTVIDGLIKHEFTIPQSDDAGPHDHALPSDYNNGHVLSGGSIDGQMLTWDNALASKGKFRTLVAGSGLTVTVASTTITVGLTGGVMSPSIGGTGLDTSASNGVPSINGGSWIINNVLTTNRVLVAAAGNTIASFSSLTYDGSAFVASGNGGHAFGTTSQSFQQFTVGGSFIPSAAGAALAVSTTLNPPANASCYGLDLYPTINKAATGTHTTFASVIVEVPTIGAGASTLTNAATMVIVGAPSAGTNNYALWVQGGRMRVDLAGPHGFGGNVDLDVQYFFRGSFTPTGTGTSFGARFAGTQLPAAGGDASIVSLAGAITEAASGTHANLNGLLIDPPVITGAAATVTNSTSLKINGAPNASGATQRALWVTAGNAQFDANVGISAVPTVPLDIGALNATANVRITDSTNGARLRLVAATVTADFYNSGGAGQIGTISAHSMKFTTNNTSRMEIGASGNGGYGIVPQSGILFDVAGSFTSLTATQVEGLSCRATLTPGGNFNCFGGVYLPTLAVASNAAPLTVGMFIGQASTVTSGSITSAISLYVDAPTGAAPTNAASLYIAAGPTNGTSVNYALWVDSGKTRFDNQVTVPAYDSHVIGSLTGNTGVGLLITSSFASGQAFARVLQIDATVTAGADSGNLVGIYLNPVLTERAAGTHALLAGMYVAPTAVNGAATVTTAAGIYIDTTAWAAGTTEASGLTINAPTGATTNYGILVNSGSMRLAGSGANHVIGTTLDADVQLKLGGTFTGAAGAHAIRINTQIQPAAGNSSNGIIVTPTIVEAGSGTHAILSGIYIQPSITAGAANVTEGAGVYVDAITFQATTTTAAGLLIKANPTGATTNYGIFVAGTTSTGVKTATHMATTAPNTRTDAGNAYTLTDTDNYIIVNKAATFTLTLPTAANYTGRLICVQTYTANTVVSATSNVVPKGGGAAATAILPATQGAWAWLVSDGTNWIIMSSGT